MRGGNVRRLHCLQKELPELFCSTIKCNNTWPGAAPGASRRPLRLGPTERMSASSVASWLTAIRAFATRHTFSRAHRRRPCVSTASRSCIQLRLPLAALPACPLRSRARSTRVADAMYKSPPPCTLPSSALSGDTLPGAGSTSASAGTRQATARAPSPMAVARGCRRAAPTTAPRWRTTTESAAGVSCARWRRRCV